MTPATLHAEMQRLHVCLIHVSDHWLHGSPGFWPGMPFPPTTWEGNWPTFVAWEHRAVLVDTRELTDSRGRLLHELVHAVYKDPPQDMSPETYTWMYAAEYSLAKRWDWLMDWEHYMRQTPIEQDTGGQALWKWLSPTQRLRHLKDWRALLREDELMKHNHLLPPPRWPGQDIHCLPRGFYELVGEATRYQLEKSTFVGL